MLVLKRRKGESIIINERIRIRIVETGNGGCQLAFYAPLSDRIRREELPPFEEELLQQTAAALGVPE